VSPTAVTTPRRVTTDRGRRVPRRASAARPPRRVSGPVAGRPRGAQATRDGVALGHKALAVVRGLPDHSVVDRLVRGRAWIPVLGVLLAGIVAMQVEILKLGTSMGRSVQRSTALQSQNELLQANVAALSDDQRIEQLAAGMGMAMPAPTADVFLTAHPGADVGRAVANIHAPDPSGFAAQLAAQAAAAAALMPSTPPTSASSGTAPATTASAAATTTASTPAAGAVAASAAPTSSSAPAAAAAPSSAAATPPAGSAGQTSAGTGTGTTAPGTPAGGAAVGTGATVVTGAAAPSPSQSGGAAGG
jgi:cell division protein FtsL